MVKAAEHLEGSMAVLKPRRGQAITIRLSEAVHESLRNLAEANERSVSGEIRWVLRRYTNTRSLSMSESERLEVLDALKQSHGRYLAALTTCASLVERQANQGDPLAKYVIGELDKAEIALKAENMAGHAFLDEARAS